MNGVGSTGLANLAKPGWWTSARVEYSVSVSESTGTDRYCNTRTDRL